LFTFCDFFAMTLSRLMKVSNFAAVSKLGGTPEDSVSRG
jgi:hypothetical protein